MNPPRESSIITVHPGSFPKQPVIWPASRQVRNQVQQTKGSSQPLVNNVLPTTQPNASAVEPRTTPANVSHVRVVSRKAVAGNKTLTVQFNHPSNDPYFSGVNVYLRRAGQQPTLVAGGAQSPVHFTVPTHTAPHTIYVSSISNWGETDVLKSPSHPVRLV